MRLKRYPIWLLEVESTLQKGKETNVVCAASLLNNTLIESGQTFSYHHLVGRPSRRRGFVDGLEMHDGRMSKGVGGGCCQIANMLYQLALLSGLEIIERHRHSLDLYPDSNRVVPFGCGATVFYNQADLRFRNPFPLPIFLEAISSIASSKFGINLFHVCISSRKKCGAFLRWWRKGEAHSDGEKGRYVARRA